MNEETSIVIFISFSCALIISISLIPVILKVTKKFHLYDLPDSRKIHTNKIPRLGGVAIFISMLLTSLLLPLFIYLINGKNWYLTEITSREILLVSAGIVIFTVGLIDDIKSLSPKWKLLGQMISAILACSGGALIHSFTIPFIWYEINLGVFSFPLTIIWIIGITNALNMIDGMDGLTSIIAIITSLTFGIIFYLESQLLLSLVSFILMGALLGFLLHNFPPAKIFIGDSGAMFAGFFFSVAPLLLNPQADLSLVLPITMLIIPILDVIAAIWRRKREKRPVFEADLYHMHHKLLKMGFDERDILSIICSFSLFFGLTIILYIYLPVSKGIYFIMADWIAGILFFILLHYKHMAIKKV